MAYSEYHEQMHLLAQMRAKTALNLKASGMTWEEVGRALGVTRQRAQQMASKYKSQVRDDTPASADVASAP